MFVYDLCHFHGARVSSVFIHLYKGLKKFLKLEHHVYYVD